MGTPDYGSGIVAYLTQQALDCDIFPSNGVEMTFQEKMEIGFDFGGGSHPMFATRKSTDGGGSEV